MITVRNRTLIVPEGERVIGTDYDNNSEVRQFRVEKAPGGIDISHLAFRLDLMYQGEIYDTCKLEKEEREDSMILAWTVAATNVAHPGTVWISLRAIDDAGTVKWGSNAAALYVQSSVNTPSHASGMTELEEHEKKMEDLLLKSEEAVSRANNATSKAETAIQTTTEAVKTAQTAATSAGSSADLAEAWAHGKKGYTAQTNDNAMYWSEQSKKRAESAKEQADRAKIYADSIAPLMDRGEYSSGTTYQENDLVKYQNAIWRCKIDGTASVPQEGENWTLFFRGVQSINELVAADVQGLLGQEGAQRVNAQALIDAVAEKIATKLLLKSDVVSQLVNDATKAASSAAVYALQQKLGTGDLPNGMSDVVAGLKALNSDLNNMWSLSGNQTLVPNNSDMHTYLTPGNYYCASNTNAETLKNSPLKFAFTMKVYLSVGIGSQYLIQEYTKYDASERILVYYDGNRNIWTSYHVQLEKMV